MKPSHFKTPRTMAECSFTIGHYAYTPAGKTTTAEKVLATVGSVFAFGIILAGMLGFFDVLVK